MKRIFLLTLLGLSAWVSQAQRPSVVVRYHGQDSVHTSRIPGIATTPAGTLLAIYDARYESARDLQGRMAIGLSRSTDGGRTWEPMRIVLDMGRWGRLPAKYNGVSDACILVDSARHKIYVAGLWMHGLLDSEGRWIKGLTEESTRWQHQWAGRGSQPGLSPYQTCQFLIAESSDDGQTWSYPRDITSATKDPSWWLYAPAPGKGIVTHDGVLVFPTQGRDSTGMPFSNITWSRDGGRTWHASAPAASNTTESAVVELSDGRLMLNMRNNRRTGRVVCTTSDLGAHWEVHPTSESALIEPVCMASLHRHTYTENGTARSLLLFCNPASRTERRNMTLRVSRDDGMTWSRGILLDSTAGYGYSCITSIDPQTVGVFFESSQERILFQRITLDELLREE